MNYIHLMNWFWQEVPYRPGYKSEYGILFLGIVDLCNRNDWRETSAEYDRMINRVRISKRLYYEGIKWLAEGGLISYQRGHNDYSPARFGIKVEVQKGDSTAPLPTPLPPHCDTPTATTVIPIIDKPLNPKTNKPLNVKKKYSFAVCTAIESFPYRFSPFRLPVEEVAKQVQEAKQQRRKEAEETRRAEAEKRKAEAIASFELWYRSYGRYTTKKDALQKWLTMSERDRQRAIDYTPTYIASRDVQFRKDPVRYLKGEPWLDMPAGGATLPGAPPAVDSLEALLKPEVLEARANAKPIFQFSS